MSEHGHVGATGRMLHKLAVGTPQRVRRKDRRDTANRPSEMEQQYQFSIKGTAAAELAWTVITVNFVYAYLFAPANRDSGLEFPHFTYGSHTTPATGVHATVSEWLRDEDNGSIIGAKVSVAAVGSGAFTGFVHLTFQGYGALIEPDEEPLMNEG